RQIHMARLPRQHAGAQVDCGPRPRPLPGQGDTDRLDPALRGHRVEGPGLPQREVREITACGPDGVEVRSDRARRVVHPAARPPAAGDDLRARAADLPAVNNVDASVPLVRDGRDARPPSHYSTGWASGCCATASRCFRVSSTVREYISRPTPSPDSSAVFKWCAAI